MVKVTYNGDASAHFGGHVFKPGESKDFEKDNPRLDYFRRHPDYDVEAKKKKSAKKD